MLCCLYFSMGFFFGQRVFATSEVDITLTASKQKFRKVFLHPGRPEVGRKIQWGNWTCSCAPEDVSSLIQGVSSVLSRSALADEDEQRKVTARMHHVSTTVLFLLQSNALPLKIST